MKLLSIICSSELRMYLEIQFGYKFLVRQIILGHLYWNWMTQKTKYCTENQNWLSRILNPQIEVQHLHK
jgi:hypothetical protein